MLDLGYVFSDGQKLAVSWPGTNSCLLLSSYYVSSVETNTDFVDVQTLAGQFTYQFPVSDRVEINIRSAGEYSILPKEEADKIFLNANSMSVNELLAIAYRKMDERQF